MSRIHRKGAFPSLAYGEREARLLKLGNEGGTLSPEAEMNIPTW